MSNQYYLDIEELPVLFYVILDPDGRQPIVDPDDNEYITTQ